MVSVDRRTGSADVEPILQAMRVPTRLEELPAGDFSFEGNGPHGLVMVGVERKRIKDALSCMRDGRLVGEQLPKLFDLYDFSYLVVEGVIRANPESGMLEEWVEWKGRGFWREVEVGRSRFMAQDLDHWLTTLEHSRIKVRRTDNATQTAYAVRSLWSWYREKTWEQHKSLRALYSAPYPTISLEDKSSLVRRVAKELDGIGVGKSLAVSMKFRTVEDMVGASEREWESIPGIGPVISRNVWCQIRGKAEGKAEGKG